MFVARVVLGAISHPFPALGVETLTAEHAVSTRREFVHHVSIAEMVAWGVANNLVFTEDEQRLYPAFTAERIDGRPLTAEQRERLAAELSDEKCRTRNLIAAGLLSSESEE